MVLPNRILFCIMIIQRSKTRLVKYFQQLYVINSFYILFYIAVYYGSFILLFPVFALFQSCKKFALPLIKQSCIHPIVLSSLKTTFNLALFATLINCFFCLIIAWVLTEFRFPGKKILEIAIDIPFALPTSVGGLTLMNVYSDQGWMGPLCSTFGVKIAFTQLGVLFAMIFVSFSFVVRTIQPVLVNIDNEIKEASWCLGTSQWTTFWCIVFPFFRSILLSGVTLAFSRAISEYGSIVLISSNIPRKDLVISVLIFQKLEQYDYQSAISIALFMLIFAFSILYMSNYIQMSILRWKK